MKTLFIAKFFMPVMGGSTRWYEEIYNRYPAGSVIVLTQKTQGWEDYDRKSRLSIYRMNPWGSVFLHPKWLKKYLAIFGKAIQITLREHISIIHCDIALPAGLLGFCLSKIFRIPYLVYAHGEEITQYSQLFPEKYVTPFIYRHADAIIANSQFTKDLLLGMGVGSEKINLIYPGVDTRMYCPAAKIANLKNEFDLEDKKVLLTVGRLLERKGHNQVIKALPGLLTRFPNLIYLIAGTGPQEHALRELSAALGVSNSVHFLGYVNDDMLPSVYNLADIFIMPNLETNSKDIEGFGMVFIEANACGKPVIGGRSGGTESSIIHENTGLLVNANNLNEICDAVIRLLNDEDFARLLGQNGRERAVSQFGWESCLQKIQQIGKRNPIID